MTIDKPDMLLWMDVETTGLDPDHDRILEVELRCTDMRGVRCVGGFHRVIGLQGRKASITDGNLKAWRMRCTNGLLEDPTLPEPPAAPPPHRHGHHPRQSRSRRMGCETGRGDAYNQRPPHQHLPRPRHQSIRAPHPQTLRTSGPIHRHERSNVMDAAAVILLCAAILIGWMANRQ